MDFQKICQRIIEYSFYSLFFLVPLIMTPWNFELFEYNKMMLTYGFTVIIVATWLSRMVINKKLILKRTPFDIPIFIFLCSQVLSTVFSIDRHTSLYGYYSRFHGGLFSTLSYILLYYAFVSNLDKAQTIRSIKTILTSALLVTLYGILEHFGIDAKYWVQDVKNRVFSTLGQPNWLAAWLVAIMPITLAFSINSKVKMQNAKLQLKIQNFLNYKFILLFLIFSVCLLFTKSRSAIPAFAVSLGFFFLLFLVEKVKTINKKFLIPSLLIFVVVMSTVGFIGFKKLFKNTNEDIAYIFDLSPKVTLPVHYVADPGSESGDIRKVVWRGAVKIFKANPFFGSGVETFAYSYYNFRPMEHNLLSEWDFLYNKAHNEYFNFLATTGAVGFGSYILLIGWIIGWFVKRALGWVLSFESEHKGGEKSFSSQSSLPTHNPQLTHTLIVALFSGWISILITNFFGFSVVPVALFFFLFPAFAVILLQEEVPTEIKNVHQNKKQYQNNLNLEQSIGIGSLLFVACLFLFVLIKMWSADTLYALGTKMEKAGYFEDGFAKLQQAVDLNPGEPVYRDELAYTASALAVVNATQKENQKAIDSANLAIVESDKALKISPKHLNFWRTRARIYYNLARLDPKFLNDALTALNQASSLAPTDTKIIYNIGLVYYQLGQRDKAIESLNKALKMRPPYVEVQQALETIKKSK